MQVSRQFLLEGAVYALEQCGRLLSDANMLYRNGSYSTAVALAAFAREELGRWRILLDLRKKVVSGGQVTFEEMQAQCDDHVTKQRAGMVSLTMRGDRDSGLGKVLQARIKTSPGSPEWKAVDEQIKKLDRQKERRTPDDRHRQRMSALYVNAVSADRWSRPVQEISQASARDFITDAVNDYGGQYGQRYTQLEFVKADDPELFSALAQWSDRPELPHPKHVPWS